jgi:hypothetical protein
LSELAAHADTFIRDPHRRLTPPRADCFRVEWVFRDPAANVIHVLRLIVSDAAAPCGVLRVVYAEDLPSVSPKPDHPDAP